jgi:hypothetical protein
MIVATHEVPGVMKKIARPSGTGLSASLPRHFVPGYYYHVPPGQKPFAHPIKRSSKQF